MRRQFSNSWRSRRGCGHLLPGKGESQGMGSGMDDFASQRGQAEGDQTGGKPMGEGVLGKAGCMFLDAPCDGLKARGSVSGSSHGWSRRGAPAWGIAGSTSWMLRVACLLSILAAAEQSSSCVGTESRQLVCLASYQRGDAAGGEGQRGGGVAAAALLLPRLRGGSSIAPEYQELIKSGRAVESGLSMGNVEREDMTAQLPWPEGSESKKESFAEYQKQYKTAKGDLRSTAGKLSVAEQQQKVHKITLKALSNLKQGAAVFLPVGRSFIQKEKDEVVHVLDYQSSKVLEEAICDLSDAKDSLSTRVKRLETDMQDVLNHVFRGRFQLFVDSPGGRGGSMAQGGA